MLFRSDSSGSLQQTDPSNSRAEILANSLSQLSDVRPGLKVSFSVGTFGEKFTLLKPWTSLTKSNVQVQVGWMKNILPGLNKENWTDWRLGLLNAEQQLASVRNNQNPSCQVLVWLTDGGIDLKGDSGFSLAHSAIKQICGTGLNDPASTINHQAIIMRMRQSGVSVLGVLLKRDDQLNKLKTGNSASKINYEQQYSSMSFMQPIVEGKAIVDGYIYSQGESTFACGENPIPAGQSAGALLTASDPLTLALQFARIVAATTGGSKAVVSGANPAKFLVEPGVHHFTALISSKDWALKNPSGNIIATPTSGLSSTQTAGAYQLKFTIQSQSDFGVWTIENTSNSQADVYLYTDLSMKLTSQSFVLGQPATLSGKVLNESNVPADLTKFGSSQLHVTAVGPDGSNSQSVPLKLNPKTGLFGGDFQASNGESKVTFNLTLNLTTSSGLHLEPLTYQYEAQVGLPPDYPSIVGSAIHMSELAGTKGKSNGVLDLVGSKQSDGQVCFDQPVVKIDPSPSRVSEYRWNLPSSCVSVPESSVARVKLSTSNSTQASGIVSGVIPAVFKSSKNSAVPISEGIAFDFNSKVHVDPTVRILVLLGLFILGVLIPLSVLYSLAYLNSRLSWGRGVEKAVVPVKLSSSGILSRRNGAGSALIAASE